MTELYSIINNCDETIFLLNSLISSKGFELIKIDVPLLEKNYKFLFNLPNSYDLTGTIKYPNGLVSDTFFNVFQSTDFIDNWEREYIIALKTNLGDISLEEGDIFGVKRYQYIVKFTEMLIDKIRLLKDGDIEIGCYFTYNNITNEGSLYPMRRVLFSDNILNLNEIDVAEFGLSLFDDEIINPLALRAKLFFDKSYELVLPEIRYILLVTALESILNTSKDQITHTFSRHLALINSNDKSEFKKKYKRIKELYKYRSSIVHGLDFKDESLEGNCKELRQYVRKAITFVNKLNFKDQLALFEKLNEMGFNNDD